MFGHWDGTPEWQGETVVVVGNAASLDDSVLAGYRGRYRTIAVNRAVAKVPYADMVVLLDGTQDQWDAVADFAGRKFGGVGEEVPDQDVVFPGMMYEDIKLVDGEVSVRNNLFAAIRIAQRMGAAKIILLGVDAQAYADQNAAYGFSAYPEMLERVVADVRGSGVEVTDES